MGGKILLWIQGQILLDIPNFTLTYESKYKPPIAYRFVYMDSLLGTSKAASNDLVELIILLGETNQETLSICDRFETK